jgi:poly(A) polymerase
MLRIIRGIFGRRGKESPQASSIPSENWAVARSDVDLQRPPVRRGPTVVHQPIPVSDLDPDAVKIVRRLTRFDQTAYLVGGCVRDLLLGIKPKDFDIATSATPRQVKRLFSNCRIIGRRFRLAHIYFQNGKIIEVATFRALDLVEDEPVSETEDLLIRDDNVFGTPEEDALRRDFTINALFYDLNAESVLDHADGLGDLRRRLVRTIGDPEIRFREDPIRILRAVKFAARLGFEIEAATLDALRRTRHEIPKAAPPRILEEINRFGRGGAARRSFELLLETGAFVVILPELADGYLGDPTARGMLGRLLEAIDRRRAANAEIRTSEILAALFLPPLASRAGWSAGTQDRLPRGLDLRALVDERLRPLALRLRVARRDQEHCRQILQTLLRMVPHQGLKRGVKQAILRRTCFGDALWMLQEAGAALGGVAAEAASFWASGAPDVAKPGARPAGPLPEEAPPARPKRRRRRRRSRRDEEAGAGAAASPAVPQEAPGHKTPSAAAASKLPSPWSDDYFFAALPTVPPLDEEDGGRDRYGASDVTPPASPDESSAEVPEATPGAEEPQPARRRRRRKRRRGKGGNPSPEASPAGSDGGGADDEP